jgi:transcriptional antiterminator
MTKQTEKSIAVELRQKGLSYEEIKVKMNADGHKVSKGSLTNWLKDIPLTEEQKKELLRKEHRPGLEAIRKKREKRISESHVFSNEEQKKIDGMLIDGGFKDDKGATSPN